MLITDDYRKQQEELHENPNYGMASVTYAPLVTSLIDSLEINDMLDYGCGKGRLAQNIEPSRKVLIEQYDPAMPEFSAAPEPRELVACIDVLEHIEPELIDNILDHLQTLTKKYGIFTIHTGPAKKTLPDGRNAHLIQEDYTWWLPKLWSRFRIHSMSHAGGGFYVVVKANGDNNVRIIKASDRKVVTPD